MHWLITEHTFKTSICTLNESDRLLVNLGASLSIAIGCIGLLFCRFCNTVGNVPTTVAHVQRYGSEHNTPGCGLNAWVLVLGADQRVVVGVNSTDSGICMVALAG